jgi:hypothetical protein
MDAKELKSSIVQAGYKAVHELIRVAEEEIIKDYQIDVEGGDNELAADRLKNAAATKKLAIFDAFEILTRIEAEKNLMENKPIEKKESFSGFAERRSK